jgi:SNF2 family DNA or RNA helicase
MSYLPLHNYQLRSVEFIQENTHAGLFAEMGTGKTLSTLTAINSLMYEDFEIDSVLIIAPKRVAEVVWSDEIDKWPHLKNLTISKVIGNEKQRIAALKAKASIHVVSRDNVPWLVGQFGGSFLPFDMLVIDESSSFKNHASERFKALKHVQACFKRVVLLTGTPAPNGLIDLWPQLWLLDRGERLGKTITFYRSNFFSKKYSGFGYDAQDGADDRIHNKIKDICMSLKSSDYLELPERIDTFINVVLPPAVKRKYDEFERKQVLEMVEAEDISAMNAAALSNKLLQFAGGAVYDEERNIHEVHACKLDACEEFIEAANGKPVFIAYSYKHELSRLLTRLKKYKPVKLETQQHIKDWNAGKIQVMLAHPASASHGLNLQEGHTMALWFSLNWSLELYQQFNKRLHRQGRKYPVVIGHLIAQDTEDETVKKALDRKGNTQDILMDAVKAKIRKYGLSFNKR